MSEEHRGITFYIDRCLGNKLIVETLTAGQISLEALSGLRVTDKRTNPRKPNGIVIIELSLMRSKTWVWSASKQGRRSKKLATFNNGTTEIAKTDFKIA
jgi:hypothetical protein